VRSEDPDRVVGQVRTLVEKGFPEIVLSGIHLGAYGLDRTEAKGLTLLLQRLVRIPGDFRIRLSSLEPGEVDAGLIDLVTGEEKICNHLHIPLQSGDPEILRRMKRPYTPEQFANLVVTLRSKDPQMAIGTDLIVGLPGETDDSFERTCEWISSLALTHFHIFPYSPRPGTEAASMAGQVSASAKKERAARLRDLCRRMKRRFLGQMVGRTLRAVPISHAGNSGPGLNLLTENYFEGRLLGSSVCPAAIFPVKVLEILDDKVLVRLQKHQVK
jgi:threonylcarbamoyladenosine tRNA methylthiotransferase MtaB